MNGLSVAEEIETAVVHAHPAAMALRAARATTVDRVPVETVANAAGLVPEDSAARALVVDLADLAPA
jgi:hypothetical protein